MPDGRETEVGSIVGYLRLDKSDWDAQLRDAERQADKLGRTDPDIRISTSGAPAAIAQLEAVAAATHRMESSTSSDMKDVEGGAESAALSVAKIGESSASSVPAVIALGGSLAAMAAILAGPLLAVGGAGFATLALGASGLKGEVVSGLTPAFQGLEKTATTALGPGINDAVAQLSAALPKLSPLITLFGGEIGNVADQFTKWLNNGGITLLCAVHEGISAADRDPRR